MGFKPDDCKFIDLYADYKRMHSEGERTTYIVTVLSERYGVSERKIYSIIKRFGKYCTFGAV